MAKQVVDRMIDVKTQAQFDEMVSQRKVLIQG
jgi:hypothetical protein